MFMGRGKVIGLALLLMCQLSSGVLANTADMNQWFREFKQQASPQQLYAFLWDLPKGGDLHHHLSGSGFSEWWYELATTPALNGGYTYYTKTIIKQCRGYGSNEFGADPQYLLFKTIQESRYKTLSECEKQEYTPLTSLSKAQKLAFLNSIRLDKPYEGRDEFFQTHWQRLNDLTSNPTLMAQILLRNMQEYQKEGLQYLETQVNMQSKLRPDGSIYTPQESLAIFKNMLASQAAKDTKVTVKFQYSLLRFLPNAEDQLRWMHEFVDANRDSYVGINMVGREDNDKGHPLRFLPVYREMRLHYPQIKLAIHAGEVDEPNAHVRNTLLLGADRIGHGLNTITDPDTLLLMRHGPYLIEINLISNQLLEYVDDYSQHPFGEYLRTGIPVALSTDDRGMWDSRMTDEYYVAVTQFNLSWDELISLGENSLAHSFLSNNAKQQQLTRYHKRINKFASLAINNERQTTPLPPKRFICQFEPILCQVE